MIPPSPALSSRLLPWVPAPGSPVSYAAPTQAEAPPHPGAGSRGSEGRALLPARSPPAGDSHRKSNSWSAAQGCSGAGGEAGDTRVPRTGTFPLLFSGGRAWGGNV